MGNEPSRGTQDDLGQEGNTVDRVTSEKGTAEDMNGDDYHGKVDKYNKTLSHYSTKGTDLSEVNNDDYIDDEEDEEEEEASLFVEKQYNFVEREAMRMARNPCCYFWVSLLGTLALGVIGLIFGDFAVAADNSGWWSRGTLIADRQTQLSMVQTFNLELFTDTTDQAWLELISTVQEGWESDDDDRRRLLAPPVTSDKLRFDNMGSWGHRLAAGMQMQPLKALTDAHLGLDGRSIRRAALLPTLSDPQMRLLSTLNNTEGTLLEGCDTSWYTSPRLYEYSRLWPIWRTKRATSSFFDSDLMEELCLTEQETQSYLEEQNLCIKCQDTTRCLQPFSPVLYARLTVDGGMSMSCQELAAAWKAEGQDEAHKNSLNQCVEDLLASYNIDEDALNLPESCPYGFFPTMLDELYPSHERAEYSSTIFATPEEAVEDLFDAVDNFPQGKENISGAYDTQYEDFVNLALDQQLIIDMSLAIGSAVITTLAMVVHTRSPFLSVVGLAQIVLSFPLAFFFYSFVAQLNFFPFLNFIGIFVIFALGADDVFVAVDKWRNARLKYPSASVEEVAAMSLPDAAMAMFLTSITTAAAFFGTAVCPVAPILCFAVFCGLLVVFDYILCVLLVFPALCIYDQADQERRCCCHCSLARCCKRKKTQPDQDADDLNEDAADQDEDAYDQNEDADDQDEDADEQDEDAEEVDKTNHNKAHIEGEVEDGLIHRILRWFYKFLHSFRWPLLVICVGSLIWCTIVASQMGLPDSSDVRLYNEDDNQYEQNFVWRKNLLFSVLDKKAGSEAYVIWGVSPADTGDRNNPEEWSQLVLDRTFIPSDTEAQEYLLGFCDRFFAEEFATTTDPCPMNAFDAWLKVQSASDSPNATYTDNCNGATQIPMPEEDFDACMYSWSQDVQDYRVLARQGEIKVIYIPFSSRVRYDSPFDDLESEWKSIENWMDDEQSSAPPAAQNGYVTSEDFWWYDTNKSMLATAYSSALVALVVAAAVILFSSKSVVLTIYATLTIGYVLVSVTAILVALGWDLGFLESILFAILIGISCDFVIHFSHAYSHLKGHRSKEERTLYALLSMGPSILAGAFTTFGAALVMLFTVIVFFQKFAIVLFLTVIQSLVGSFVVFLTMTVSLGPSDPTYVVDHVMAKCFGLCGRKVEIQGDQEDDEIVDMKDTN